MFKHAIQHTVITGCGIVHPAGSVANLSESLSFSYLMDDSCCNAVAELTDYFSRPALRRLPLYAKISLLAAIKALQDAELWPCPKDIPILIGSSYSCQKTSFDFMDSILDFGPKLASPLAFSHAVNNVAAGLLSIMLQSTGSCMTVNNGPLSFAGALQTGITMLKSGKANHVLVGAVDEFDPRFAALFPQKKLLPSAVFFCLRRDSQGKTVALAWEDKQGSQASFSADTHNISICSGGVEDSLFQPLACAVWYSMNHDTGVITQTASEYDIAAIIRLNKTCAR